MLFNWFGNCAPPFRPIKLKSKNQYVTQPRALRGCLCLFRVSNGFLDDFRY